MALLLKLPVELRVAICRFIPSNNYRLTHGCVSTRKRDLADPSTTSYRSLMSSCRQLLTDVTPFFYQSIHLELDHPNEFLDWIVRIGPNNSSCIENIVLKTSSLVIGEEAGSWANESAWALALRSMPRLRNLTIQFSQDSGDSQSSSPVVTTSPDPSLLQKLSVQASECLELSPIVQSTVGDWCFQPNLRGYPFTHAFFSLRETVPPILVQYFNTTARNRQGHQVYAPQTLDRASMEKNIAGLPSSCFNQNGFFLTDTCAFNENNENANAVLTFLRTPQPRVSPYENLRSMMRDLPNLGYLRIGCRDLDSTFLIHVPKHLHTLDVAFTDENAERIADNLMTMRGICRNLFTLAVDISPLHDREEADDRGREEIFFDRQFVSQEVAEKWEPVWKALDEIKASKVKIWEGEGPGFRRSKDS